MIHWVQSHIELVKLCAAAIAFVVGLLQYRRTQKWKRLEFVAAEMKVFFDDPAVRLAMTMLDWRKKQIALYKHRDANNTLQETVDYEIVASALGVDPETKYDKVESAIREIFERFLEFLARFEGFVATKLVKPKDLMPYFDYWVRLISGNDPHSPEATQKVLPSLWHFIDYYHYRDVRKFIRRYHQVAFPEVKD